jgi:hypothetical protein
MKAGIAELQHHRNRNLIGTKSPYGYLAGRQESRSCVHHLGMFPPGQDIGRIAFYYGEITRQHGTRIRIVKIKPVSFIKAGTSSVATKARQNHRGLCIDDHPVASLRDHLFTLHFKVSTSSPLQI